MEDQISSSKRKRSEEARERKIKFGRQLKETREAIGKSHESLRSIGGASTGIRIGNEHNDFGASQPNFFKALDESLDRIDSFVRGGKEATKAAHEGLDGILGGVARLLCEAERRGTETEKYKASLARSNHELRTWKQEIGSEKAAQIQRYLDAERGRVRTEKGIQNLIAENLRLERENERLAEERDRRETRVALLERLIVQEQERLLENSSRAANSRRR